MTPLLIAVLALMLAVMSVGWVVQRRAGNAGWIDVFWTFGTGAACACAALVPVGDFGLPSPRQMLVAALVAAWSLRLGVYIARRVTGGAEDVRYRVLRREWGEAFQFRALGLMLIQAPVTALLALAVLQAARNPAPVLGEGVADDQMRRFKADPGNHGHVCDTGLWAWSRHPNYLFELVGWFAYPAIAFRPSNPWSLLALIAPVMMFLVLRFGTGVPPLEAAMVESKGDAYRRYQARVSPFLPRPPKSNPL